MARETFVDVSFIGDRELERKLRTLAGPMQRKIVRAALRESAKRTLPRVISNLSGEPVGVRTGTLRAAFAAQKVRAGRSRRGIRLGITFPTRDELGIAPDDPYFYPAAVEYGHSGVAARPFLRPAVDNHRSAELSAIGAFISRRIRALAQR
jgi:hypothetical protein